MARGRRPKQSPPVRREVEANITTGGWLGLVACVSVALLAFVFSFNKLDDFDTWWHLAAGRSIATLGAVPATDTLSHTVRNHPWINIQWGFDLGLYKLHAIGGPILLSVAGASAFTLAVALMLRLIAKHLGGSLGALLGLIVVLAAQERVALRPELLSFVLLAAVLWVLEKERTGPSRWLVLLVPLMLVWANVHALFVIGAFAIVSALAGSFAAPSRRLMTWSAAALLVILVNPYGLTGALFPMKLMSRINGSVPVFQTIAEFASPFAPGASGLSIIFYKILLAAGIIAALWALAAPRGTRGFDWGGLIFFAGLAAVSVAARRNIAIFAIGGALFIARSLATALAGNPRARRFAARRAPLAGAAVVCAVIILGAGEVSGALTRWDHQPREFGAGVIDGTFPVRAAAFARAAQLPSRLYNDMSAGGYLSWDDPIGDGVFVDGRLEVYDVPFLTEMGLATSDAARWQADADRYGIQTAIIFHRFEPGRLIVGRLAQNAAWTLVYGDEVAAIFVRTAGNDAAIARAGALRAQFDAETAAWLARPAPSWPYPAGRAEATRAYARFLATIGKGEDAVAAYKRLLELRIPDADAVETRLLLMNYYSSRNRLDEAREQAQQILAIEPNHPGVIRR